MSRTRPLLVMVPVLVLLLACQTLLKPVNDAKNVAETAQSFATKAIEMATDMSPLSTQMISTSEPESSSTQVPDGNIPADLFDPQGTPLSSWKDIPIMPQAVAGQELQSVYSFRAPATAAEVHDFYAEKLPVLGWSSLYSSEGMPFEVYTKDDQTLTITITEADGSVVVLLALG